MLTAMQIPTAMQTAALATVAKSRKTQLETVTAMQLVATLGMLGMLAMPTAMQLETLLQMLLVKLTADVVVMSTAT
jgi:hypothetical protein